MGRFLVRGLAGQPTTPAATLANLGDDAWGWAARDEFAAPTAGRMTRAVVTIHAQDSAADPLDLFSPALLIKCIAAPAGVRRAATPTVGERTMRYRIELTDDLMQVLDEDGYGHDAHVVRKDGADAAEQKIDEWGAEYGIDPALVKRELRDLIRRM